jgi:hypothetical protein
MQSNSSLVPALLLLVPYPGTIFAERMDRRVRPVALHQRTKNTFDLINRNDCQAFTPEHRRRSAARRSTPGLLTLLVRTAYGAIGSDAFFSPVSGGERPFAPGIDRTLTRPYDIGDFRAVHSHISGISLAFSRI